MKKRRSERNGYRLPRKLKKNWRKFLIASAQRFAISLSSAGKAIQEVVNDIRRFEERTRGCYSVITKEEHERRMIAEFGCTKETANAIYEVGKRLNEKYF